MKVRGILSKLVGALTCACCLLSSDVSAKPKLSQSPVVRVPVYFATDRTNIGSNKISEGFQLSKMWLGSATVTVPADNRWLSNSKADLIPQYVKMGWILDGKARTQIPYVEARGYVAEYEMRDQCLNNVKQDSEFWSHLKSAAGSSPFNTVLVYIHGFAASGDNSLYAGGILSAQTECPVVVFSWPSEGTVGLRPPTLIGDNSPKARIRRDTIMIDQKQVLEDLKQLIHDAREKLEPSTKLSLVAHSLGNRLLTNYILSDAKEVIDSLYFIAADVDEQLFEKAIPAIKRKSNYTAVYQNRSDLVLLASFLNNMSELKYSRKLGDSTFEVPNIEFIDYSYIAEPNSLKYRWLKHYLPFEQFGSILRTGGPYNPDPKRRPLTLIRESRIQPSERFSK